MLVQALEDRNEEKSSGQRFGQSPGHLFTWKEKVPELNLENTQNHRQWQMAWQASQEPGRRKIGRSGTGDLGERYENVHMGMSTKCDNFHIAWECS